MLEDCLWKTICGASCLSSDVKGVLQLVKYCEKSMHINPKSKYSVQ